MANYQSSYTGAQIDAGIAKANTALQEEQYTGTYSKPSGGIPKTDLASAVQTSLDKADNTYTKTEVDTAISNAIDGVAELIGGAS